MSVSTTPEITLIMIENIDKFVRPHVKDILDTPKLHILYKQDQNISTWLNDIEIMLPDDTIIQDNGLIATSSDYSVQCYLDMGFVYLGVGVIRDPRSLFLVRKKSQTKNC